MSKRTPAVVESPADARVEHSECTDGPKLRTDGPELAPEPKLAPDSMTAVTTRDASPAEPRLAAISGDDPEPEVPPLTHKLVMGTAVALPMLGVVAAIGLLWQFGWMGWLYLGMLVVGWILTGLGITVGFHRLLTHRSFGTYRGIRAFWTAMGCLSVEGSPLIWCAVHRRHHELSDMPGDPHSPRLHGNTPLAALRGLVHAHVGWLFSGHWTSPELKRYIPDLLQDPWLVAVDRYYYLLVLASLLLPTLLGGLVTMSWWGAVLGLVWGGLVRIFVTHHITWSINSLCHVFGRRAYRTTDQSTNNVLCGILGLGEGWHNNHHAFPTSARHGLAWWQFDLSWIVIRTMQAVGLAWDVRLPTARQMAERQLASGSSSAGHSS